MNEIAKVNPRLMFLLYIYYRKGQGSNSLASPNQRPTNAHFGDGGERGLELSAGPGGKKEKA